MSIVVSLLSRMTAGRKGQEILARIASRCEWLMGIGCGGSVGASGERAIFDELERRAAQPLCIFDVGANRGQFLELARRRLDGKQFGIHCFEPGAVAFDELRRLAGSDSRVIHVRAALGRRPGEGRLFFDRPGSQLASLHKRRLEHKQLPFDLSEQVRIDTVDDYCRAQGITRIDLMKIDVEGHELEVLAGAQRMLRDRAIGIVTFEFGGCNIDSRTYFRDFYYLFRDAGMNIFRITPRGYLYPVESYKEEHEQFRTTNFMAVEPRA